MAPIKMAFINSRKKKTDSWCEIQFHITRLPLGLSEQDEIHKITSVPSEDSAWASPQSDQSPLTIWRNLGP